MINYLTVTQFAKILNLHRETVAEKVRTGEIFSVKLFGSNHLIRIPETEIKKALGEKGVNNA